MKNPQLRAKKPWFRCIGAGLAAAMTVVAATGATEEANEADDDEDYIEEIVVTATYRETAELDTPVSMGTVSGDLIEETGALDFNDIAHLVSGLSYSGQNESENAITIRGVSDGSVRGESYSVTSVYYDDAPVSGVTSPGRHGSGTAFDMERVEVLMGPQGVLGGAGNIAGLVRFVTKKPELNAWRAKVQANFQSINSGGKGYRIDAMVNAPVVEDTLALRVLAFTTDTPGWIDRPEFDDYDRNTKEIRGGRITGKWVPTDELQVRATWANTESHVVGDARPVRLCPTRICRTKSARSPRQRSGVISHRSRWMPTRLQDRSTTPISSA